MCTHKPFYTCGIVALNLVTQKDLLKNTYNHSHNLSTSSSNAKLKYKQPSTDI